MEWLLEGTWMQTPLELALSEIRRTEQRLIAAGDRKRPWALR